MTLYMISVYIPLDLVQKVTFKSQNLEIIRPKSTFSLTHDIYVYSYWTLFEK